MPARSHISPRWIAAILIAAALAFTAKVILNRNTFGSTDALLWEANLRQLRSGGALALYRNGTVLSDAGVPYHSEVFNHPPFMIHLLSWWGALADATGLPLHIWIRLTCAAADLGSVFLLLGILRRAKIPVEPGALLLTVCAPASLMISGFHGNTDPIFVALLLLAVYLLETGPPWLAGMALGMASNIKIVPVIFAPAMFLFLRGRKRVGFASAAIAVFVLGSLPVLADDPLLVMRSVFGYNPQSGIWGGSAFMLVGAPAAVHVYARVAKLAALGLIAAASVWMNRGSRWGWRPPAPFLQCAFLSFLFLAVTPGFGVQYMAWLVPWTCLLRVREAIAVHLTSGVFLFAYYTRGCGRVPWYLANSARTPVWNGWLILLGLVCWAVICVMVVRFAARLLVAGPANEVSAEVAPGVQSNGAPALRA